MRRRIALALLAAVVPHLAAGDSADADDDSGDDSATPLEPLRVKLTPVVGAKIELTARFEHAVAERSFLFGALSLHVPTGAIVTAATATVGGTRTPLRLVDAERSAAKLDAIGVAPATRDPAWAIRIADADLGHVEVDLAVPRATRIALDLVVEMTSCYWRDARHVLLPRTWSRALPAALARRTPVEDDELAEVCGEPDFDEPSEWVALPSRVLASQPPGAGRVGVLAARLPLGDRHLAAIEIDLASSLGEIPRDLFTAIVVDRSRSLTADEVAAQQAIVASYLRAAPATSRVQVIAYDRQAHAVLPGWLPAATSAARVDRELRALAPRNGSNVDAGLAEAAAWLARAPGTRRVVVFTDDRLAERLTANPAALRRVLPADTLVHVVSVQPDTVFSRDDGSALAPLARATEGLAVSGSPDDDGRVDAAMLVRPRSLDHVTIAGPGWQELQRGERSCPADGDSLPEGTSCTWLGDGRAISGPIRVEGMLWGKNIARVVRPDPSQARTLARTLSANRIIEDPDLRLAVERAAFAVNHVWSLLATWGGTGGYDELGGGSWIGMDPHGCCELSGAFGSLGSIAGTTTPALDLRDQLAGPVRRCRPRPARVDITIETTREEIVDVAVEVFGGDARVRACITEAVWDTSLLLADPPEHAVSRLVL